MKESTLQPLKRQYYGSSRGNLILPLTLIIDDLLVDFKTVKELKLELRD
ncbi:MAG: hypothetical protein V7L05_31730 [Nostoc sp.]